MTRRRGEEEGDEKLMESPSRNKHDNFRGDLVPSPHKSLL